MASERKRNEWVIGLQCEQPAWLTARYLREEAQGG